MFTLTPLTTPSDMLGKAYVHWKAWHEAYSGLVSADYLERLTLERCEEIARRWPDNIIVAKDGDCVVGFVGYGDRGEETPDVGEIFALYVLSEYYGTGLGRMLLEAGLQKLENYPRIVLWS